MKIYANYGWWAVAKLRHVDSSEDLTKIFADTSEYIYRYDITRDD